jgi:hypothetical protein
MARKNSIISIAANEETGALVFTVTDAGEFSIIPADLTDEIRNRAMLHGLAQKVSDAAAIAKSEMTGDAATDAMTKFNAMKAVADRLADGDWSARRGDGTGPVAGVIYRAFEEWVMAEAKKAKKPVDAETIRALYDAKPRADQLALRNVPEIATIIERIKAERGAKSEPVDTAGLLAELGL